MTSYSPATSVDEMRRRLERVRAEIDAAARDAGRDPAEVRLLPVSKTFPPDRVRLAVEAGATCLGENKVQEVVEKAEALADLDVRWAVIGHLQRNKARDVAELAHEFHALDSDRIAQALQRRLETADRTLEVYVQVNTSGEASKSGVEPDEAADLVAGLGAYDRLRVRGLMTLAAHTTDEDAVRGCFRTLRELRDRCRDVAPDPDAFDGLSMGMSGDLRLAVAEGSTVVRVGQAVFGSRPTPPQAN